MRYTIALLLVLLVACGPTTTETPPTVPTAPGQEPSQEAEPPIIVEDDTEEFENPLDAAFGPVDRNEAITADDVICDRDSEAMQIRFRNTGEKSWQLNQDVPFPPPADLASVRIMFNNYEVNGHREVIIDGERMFGPQEKFSDNCGGVEVLEPGEEVTCFLQPVPLRNQNAFGEALQELFINSAGGDGRARFSCE